MPTVVYKLGGSLLTLPDLRARLNAVLSNQNSDRPLLVIGGGAAADLVRDWDRVHQMPADVSHRLAIQSLELNESLVARLVPRTQIVASRDAAGSAWATGNWPILSVSRFLAEEEPRADGDTLPASWDVTSDSIAAWIALRWPAERFVLLKSCSLAASATNGDELVDPYFERLAPRLPRIDWINLRDLGEEQLPTIEAWPRAGAR